MLTYFYLQVGYYETNKTKLFLFTKPIINTHFTINLFIILLIYIVLLYTCLIFCLIFSIISTNTLHRVLKFELANR